jgi:hypothetical protein
MQTPELVWNKELLGNPPGSLMLTCPECLRRRNWYFAPFTEAEDAEVAMWRLQAAYRLRAGLKEVPFYANRARRDQRRDGKRNALLAVGARFRDDCWGTGAVPIVD